MSYELLTSLLLISSLRFPTSEAKKQKRSVVERESRKEEGGVTLGKAIFAAIYEPTGLKPTARPKTCYLFITMFNKLMKQAGDLGKNIAEEKLKIDLDGDCQIGSALAARAVVEDLDDGSNIPLSDCSGTKKSLFILLVSTIILALKLSSEIASMML